MTANFKNKLLSPLKFTAHWIKSNHT